MFLYLCCLSYVFYLVYDLIIIRYKNNNNNNNNNHYHHHHHHHHHNDFLSDLGRRITQTTDDHCESAFLFQRLSNAVAVLDTFTHTTPEDEM